MTAEFQAAINKALAQVADEMMPAPTKAQVGDYKFLAQMVKVNDIEFDFNCEDGELSDEEMDAITKDACTEWVVEVEGGETETEFGVLLSNQIADETGWLVEGMDWEVVTA
jgi:hypothetical protein